MDDDRKVLFAGGGLILLASRRADQCAKAQMIPSASTDRNTAYSLAISRMSGLPVALYMIGRHQVLNDVVKQRLQLVHVILGIPTAAH